MDLTARTEIGDSRKIVNGSELVQTSSLTFCHPITEGKWRGMYVNIIDFCANVIILIVTNNMRSSKERDKQIHRLKIAIST